MLAFPTEYLDNLQSWIATGHGVAMMLSHGLVQIGWEVSAIVVAAWTIGLTVLACYPFNQQDLV